MVETVLEWLAVISPISLVGVAMLGAIAAKAGEISYRGFRAYRILQDMPTSQIRSAPQGYVALEGRLEPLDSEDPVTAPFSGKPCVSYRVAMQEKHGSGDDVEWKTLFEEQDPRPCVLADDTGRCLILPALADQRPDTVADFYGDEADHAAPPEGLQGIDTGWFQGPIRFVEERVEPAQVHVVGRFVTHRSTAAGAEPGDGPVGHLLTIFRQWRTDYISSGKERPDENQPNPIASADELTDEQRAALPVAAVAWAREQTDRNDIDSVVTTADDRRRPFIVGTGEQTDVGKELRQGTIVATAIFVAAAGAAASLLLRVLGVI